MIKSEDRPIGMSQVDWLWLNYKYFNVQNESSEVPSERIILTEQAITNLIQKATSGGITTLRYEENPDDPTTMRLMGMAVNGEMLTLVVMPKEEHIISFANRKVTQTDIDNGCGYMAGADVLAITTNLGNVHMISLSDLDLQLSGSETNTAYTEVLKGVVYTNVKIDSNNNANSAVEIKQSSKGLYTQLKLDDTSTGVKLEVTENGLKASLPIIGNTSTPLAFAQLTLDEYLGLEPVENTVYFITDKPFIYLNKVRYGVNILPGEFPIVSLVYDAGSMKLYYKKADGSDIQALELGAVSEERNGMLTKEQYIEMLKLIKALDGITSVKDYVDGQVKLAAFSIEKGEPVNRQTPLYLKDAVGNILSTVWLDNEDFLSFAVQRAATEEDVFAAAAKGMKVTEGEAILILTLTSGDTVYVSLSEVADIYTGLRTNTVQVSVDKYRISADVILPADEKILYESVNGLASRISIKQNKNIITIYGKTETDEHKLGQFSLSDQLLDHRILRNFTSDMLAAFPPAKVDGADYDVELNPVLFGNTYIVLTFGLDSGDSSTSYRYNYYLNITAFLDEIKISSDQDNIITKGSDGHIYAAVQWNDIN